MYSRDWARHRPRTTIAASGVALGLGDTVRVRVDSVGGSSLLESGARGSYMVRAHNKRIAEEQTRRDVTVGKKKNERYGWQITERGQHTHTYIHTTSTFVNDILISDSRAHNNQRVTVVARLAAGAHSYIEYV